MSADTVIIHKKRQRCCFFVCVSVLPMEDANGIAGRERGIMHDIGLEMKLFAFRATAS